MTVYTRDRKNQHVLPSVFGLPSKELYHARRNMRVSEFFREATQRVDTSDIEAKFIRLRLPASVHHAILVLVTKLTEDPKVYFDSREIAYLLQMFYTITRYQVRMMKFTEFEDFLVGTLEISNPLAIAGMKRAAMMFRSEALRPERRGVTPENFIRILSFYLRGSLRDRAELAFTVMDIDQDGLLRHQVEFQYFLHGSFDAEIAATHADIDPEQPVRESIQFLINKMKMSGDSALDMPSFANLVSQEPWLISSLVPMFCPDTTNMAFQGLFTIGTPPLGQKEHKKSIFRVSRTIPL